MKNENLETRMAFIKQRNKSEAYSFSDIGKQEQILITMISKRLLKGLFLLDGTRVFPEYTVPKEMKE